MTELTTRLEHLLVRTGVPWAENLEPGLTEAQLDETFRPLGLEVPESVREWWGWRRPPIDGWLAVDFAWLGARQAAERYRQYRAIAAEIAGQGEDLDQYWPRTLLPLFSTSSSPVYAVDCSDPRRSGHIHYWAFDGDPETGFVVAASLADLLHQLCEAYEAGLQQWDETNDDWVRLPVGRRSLGF